MRVIRSGWGHAWGRINPVAGRALFVRQDLNCVQCHTLKAVPSAVGSLGPNLDKARPSYAVIIKFVIHGGGPMPQFGGAYGVLSKKQIRNIAAFVYKATHTR